MKGGNRVSEAWKRFDSSFEGLEYEGSWSERDGDNYYGGSYQLGSGESSVKFKFNGTGFRVLGAVDPAYSGEVTVYVDGLPRDTFSQNSPSSDTQVVSFEVTGLNKTDHDIVISNNSMYFLIDAIDINSEGRIYYPVGYQLTTPEEGWKRYDSSHPTLEYLGEWETTSLSNYFNNSAHLTSSEGSKIAFDFKGTDIRLVTRMNPELAKHVNLVIDGIRESFTVESEENSYLSLVYEKLGLADRRHTIEIEVIGSDQFVFDAIDTNYSGYLLHPNEVTDPLELTPGNRIRLTYSGSGNSLGVFSLLGREYYYNGISDFITPSSSIKGSFYLIAVENNNRELVLVSDRVIHTTISWNTLLAMHDVDVPIDNVVLDPSTIVGGTIDSDNLTYYMTSTNHRAMSSVGKSRGKWYWEVTKTEGSTSDYVRIGVVTVDGTYYAVQSNTGDFYREGASDGGGHLLFNEIDDVIGIALDMESKSLTYYVNGEESGTETIDVPNGVMLYSYIRSANSNNKRFRFNYGDAEFLMTPPEGFEPYSDYQDINPRGYRTINHLLSGGVTEDDEDNEWDRWIANSEVIDSSVWELGTFTITSSEREGYSHNVVRGNEEIDQWSYSTSHTGVYSDRGYRPVLMMTSKLEFDREVNLEVHDEDSILDGVLKTTFESPFEYRLILNGVPLDPPTGVHSSDGSSHIYYRISNRLLNLGENLLFVEALNRTYFPMVISKLNEKSVTVSRVSPSGVIHRNNVTVMTNLLDKDLDEVRYRVLLNNEVYRDWTSYLETPTSVSTSIPNSDLSEGTNTIRVESEDRMQISPTVEELVISVENELPNIEASLNINTIHREDVQLSVSITDGDTLDQVAFRVLVDGVQVYPSRDGFSHFSSSINQTVTISNDYFELGDNELVVEYKDDFMSQTVMEWTHNILVMNTHPTLYLRSADEEVGSQSDYLLRIEIEDLDEDSVSYRVLLNSVEIQSWSPNRPTPTNIDIIVPSQRLNFGDNEVVVEYRDDFKGSISKSWSISVTKSNYAPKIEIEQVSSSTYATITDDEGDQVHYRVELNGNQVYPAAGFSVMADSPSIYEKHFNSSELLPLGETNLVEIIARDEFGLETKESVEFESEYSGLMFSDINGELYSTDLGEVLKYLDKGIIISSQTTPSTPIRLTNTYGYPVSNLLITSETGNYYSEVEMSYGDNPFIVENELIYNEDMEYGDSVVFYVRVSTILASPPSSNSFKIFVRADPIIE